MNNLIALVGAGEYLETMAGVDQHLLTQTPASAQSRLAQVVCVPTAAGEEGDASVDRWAQMGVEHFRRLGALAESARIVDRASADDPRWAELLEAADLIYFSGGDPLYLYRTMADTRAWKAAQKAFARGAVYVGCSAGAMMLGRHVPDVRSPDLTLYPAFNVIANALIMPHFDLIESFRPGLTALLQSQLSDGQYGLGIDEHTALVGRARVGEAWEVLGAGSVSLISRDSIAVHRAGYVVALPT
jgi:cyanophycinase